MDMRTHLPGRVRNTSLPRTQALMPVFEAIVNSIQSIEESVLPVSSGWIRVQIDRGSQQSLLGIANSHESITGFTIEDNGVGFTRNHFEAFTTLDTDHKKSQGGRGISRILWLKVFESTRISSTYLESGHKRKRSFEFNINEAICHLTDDLAKSNSETGTTLTLDKCKEPYCQYCNVSTEEFVEKLEQHFLWYLARPEGCPQITVIDGKDKVSLNSHFEMTVGSSISRQEIEIKEVPFLVTHARLRSRSFASHFLALCANGRLVQSKPFKRGSLPGVYGRIENEVGDFAHGSYVTSAFLDGRVLSERMDFDLREQSEGLFSETEISYEDIVEAVARNVRNVLEKYIQEYRQRADDRIHDYVCRFAPRYRPLLKHLSADYKSIDPDISDSDLELHLHRCYAQFETNLLSEGQQILDPQQNETKGGYQDRIQNYLRKVKDIKMSDLANYVSHRRVIIDMLEKAIEKSEDGRYVREEIVHQLIAPRGVSSAGLDDRDMNLWLIDERLTFHDYLASDKALSVQPIVEIDSTQRPDINVLQLFDNPILVSERQSPPFGSLSIIELKRPMQTSTQDPVDQVLNYLEKIRNGKITTSKGRPLGNADSVPGYCYIFTDLTSQIRQRCKKNDFVETADGLGYFGYIKSYRAHIEVISFDRLVNASKERNRAFFDKLGLPVSTARQ